MYIVKFKLLNNEAVQETHFKSLVSALMQIKSNFDTKVFINLDQIISVTYEDNNKQDHSVLDTVLKHLQCSVNEEVKDQIKFKLDYLMNAC